jgi:hypothetical protein
MYTASTNVRTDSCKQQRMPKLDNSLTLTAENTHLLLKYFSFLYLKITFLQNAPTLYQILTE